MGDPKFARRRYEKPAHPWEDARIKEERELQIKYGLKNKRELWKMKSKLREIRRQARQLQGRLRKKEPQAEKETSWLVKKLINQGLLTEEKSTLDDILALNVEDILNRRFQTIAYMKGLATTIAQVRQFIVHGHISINGRKVTVPGYLVKKDEEQNIEYHSGSTLTNPNHPLRVESKPKEPKESKEPKEQKESKNAKSEVKSDG